MDSLELTNPMFWVSIVLGGIIVAAVSYGFQLAQDDQTSKQLNVKGLIRDVLLGGIFTAMAWTLFPDMMKNVTKSISSMGSSSKVADTVSTTVQSGGASTSTMATVGTVSTGSTVPTAPGTVNIQVGPPPF